MLGKQPRKPAGQSAEADHAKWVHEAVAKESRLTHVSGHRVVNTTAGKFMVPNATNGGTGSAVLELGIRFVENDYLICRERNSDGTLGSTDIYVLKPFKLRCSTTSAEVHGQTHSYTYADDSDEPFMEFGTAVPGEDYNEWGEFPEDYDSGGDLFEKRMNVERTVTADGSTEVQIVVPVWLKGDIIYALEHDGGNTAAGGKVADEGQPIEYIDMNVDGRQWARL